VKDRKINLFNHYRKLLFFVSNRNAKLMREYFAQILLTEVEEFMPLGKKKILDVGGARGEYCKVLNAKRQCEAINLDPHPGEYVWPKTITGFADKIPFKDNEFDLVICRGVLEHIPLEKQQVSVNEMYRVTRPGGICYVLIPPWFNPHAGHALRPFHIFPFKIARLLKQSVFRYRLNKNYNNSSSFEEVSLFPITFRRMEEMIRLSNFKLIATKDTHLRLHFLTKIPIVREIMVPAVAFISTKE